MYVYIYIYMSVCAHKSIFFRVCASVYGLNVSIKTIYMYVHLSIYLSIYLSICL